MAQKLDPVSISPAQPGISKRFSPLSVGDRWIDGDKVRSVDGKVEKIGGNTKKTVASVTDPIRGLCAWQTAAGLPFIGIGTYRKLYVADVALNPQNITPLDTTGTLTNPFTVTLGLHTVTVAHTAHGRSVGDQVSFSGATQVPTSTGMIINGDYIAASVPDLDHYTITHSVAALANGTGGGTVSYTYELPIGSVDPLEGDGYGAGGYGVGDYGDPSTSGATIIFDPRVWNVHAYGDLLFANPVNGTIYKFDPAATPSYQRAVALANAPSVCRSMFITKERFVFALGTGNDPLNIQWPDQDDPTNWTPGPTTTANSRRLTEGSRIIGGSSIASLISGVWTDTALYQFQYTGSTFIYDSHVAGTNCGLVSPLALVVTLAVAYWPSQNGNFFMWGGGAPQPIPNVQDVREFVRRSLRINGWEFKCNGYYNAQFNEVWWFFVNSAETEPGIYVAVSLNDFSWVVGTMQRTSGTYFKSSDQRPILAGADGWLYQHEDGLDDDGALMHAWIERAPLQIAKGRTLGEIMGMVNDMQRQTGTMSVEVKTYDRMNESPLDTEQSFFEPGEDLVDLHVGGRIASVIIRSAALGGDFRMGDPLLEVQATGSRR